jgi:hypothetical protein
MEGDMGFVECSRKITDCTDFTHRVGDVTSPKGEIKSTINPKGSGRNHG